VRAVESVGFSYSKLDCVYVSTQPFWSKEVNTFFLEITTPSYLKRTQDSS